MSTRQRYNRFMSQFARRHQMHELHRWRQKCQQPLEFQRENKNLPRTWDKRGPTVPAQRQRMLVLEKPTASQQENLHRSKVSFPVIVARGTRARKFGHRGNSNHPLMDSASDNSKHMENLNVDNSSLHATDHCVLSSKLPPIDPQSIKLGSVDNTRKRHPQNRNGIVPITTEHDCYLNSEWPEISDVEYLLLYGDELKVSSPDGSYALLAKIDKIDSLLDARSKMTPKKLTDNRYNKYVVTENQVANEIFDEVIFGSRTADLVGKEREISFGTYRPRYFTCERNFHQERKYRFHILKLTKKFYNSKKKVLLDSEEEASDKGNTEDRKYGLDTSMKKQKSIYNLKKRQEKKNSKNKCKNDASSWCKNTFLDTKKMPCSPKGASFTGDKMESLSSLIPPVTPQPSELDIDVDDSKSIQTCNKTLCYTIIMPRCSLEQSVHTENTCDEARTERRLIKVSQEVQTDRSVLRDAANRRLDKNKMKNASDLKHYEKEKFCTEDGADFGRKDRAPSLSGAHDISGPRKFLLVDDTVTKPTVKCERWLAKQCPFL